MSGKELLSGSAFINVASRLLQMQFLGLWVILPAQFFDYVETLLTIKIYRILPPGVSFMKKSERVFSSIFAFDLNFFPGEGYFTW